MISGVVDRQWAKHHYGKWYREHFEDHEKQVISFMDTVPQQKDSVALSVTVEGEFKQPVAAHSSFKNEQEEAVSASQ